MGNSQKAEKIGNRTQLTYQRLQKQLGRSGSPQADTIPQQSLPKGILLCPFACLPTQIHSKHCYELHESPLQNQISVTKYFTSLPSLEAYLSNIIKISKILDILIYDQLNIESVEEPLHVTALLDFKGPLKTFDLETVKQMGIGKKMDLLAYAALILGTFDNIVIQPQDIIQNEKTGSFHLINFKVQATPQQSPTSHQFTSLLRYLFSEPQTYNQCLLSQSMPGNMPIYLQDIYNSILLKVITVKEVEKEIKKIKDKMMFLQNRVDSFYACKYFNKTAKYCPKSDWIFMRAKHQVYFYHVRDNHCFLGRIFRKKKKKDIDDCHLTFDHEDLELLYVPQNSKFIVKTSEFEFESATGISDIEIKYKLPIKLKSPLINRSRNGHIYLLQQYLYKFIPEQNKLIQESKRIPDYIFITSTKDSLPLIIKISIDILRNGIRIFYKSQDIILAHTGDEAMLEDIATIRIDIRQVVFCIQVYKGVFLMMASKNMWILDLNFECFFSYATPSQIKKLGTFQADKSCPTQTQIPISYAHSRSNSHAHSHSSPDSKHNDFLFQIINQPFKVNFNLHNDGNNVTIKQKYMHMIGLIEEQPYYLKYSFIHRIGAIKLEGYHPLFVFTNFQKVTNSQHQPQEDENMSDYRFNFHQENSYLYKYRKWIYYGEQFVRVYDFKIKFEKNTYEAHLKVEKIEQTLKQHIQKLQKSPNKLQKLQQIAFLYKIYLLYEHIFNQSITHSNISINHIVFTSKKQLKIHGWSEPPRNWHVSDYKDYLLVCFNIITYNTYQKLNDKIIQKHQNQMGDYPLFLEKLLASFKQAKNIQKKTEIQKSLLAIKSFLEKELADHLQNNKSNKFIFSFQYKTPRMNMVNTETMKMKKIIIIPDETISEQFAFNETDKYLWIEATSKLYIFTAAHQFFEVKINTENYSEEKLSLQDYQYLPNSISSCSFINVLGNIYCFGGTKKEQDGRSTYNKKVYRFSWKALTWQPVSQLPQPRMSPHLVVSNCNSHIYIMGGPKQLQEKQLKLLKYSIVQKTTQILYNTALQNIISLQNHHTPMKFYHISNKLNIFLQWSIVDGDYIIRFISFSSIGFVIQMKVKNYSTENLLTQESISLDMNSMHILRPYGRYTKIIMNKLENISLKNQTIYAI